MFDAFKVGEKWTTVIPSTIDVDFFDSVLAKKKISKQGCFQRKVARRSAKFRTKLW